MRATYHPNALVKYVRVNLLPWQIPQDTFCSITLYIDRFELTTEKTYSQYVGYMLFVRTECPWIILYHLRPLLSVCGTCTILIPLTNIITFVWVLSRGIQIL